MTATLSQKQTRSPREDTSKPVREDTSEPVEELSRQELEALLERESRMLTGRPFREALEMLDRGELHGTAAAGALRTLRRLLLAA
ncbi:MAG: hypothetical protein HY332_20075 [Chloroflexi bacterium]|nr:hypothetical protein [Chloroflexota bacterium]